MSFTCLLPKNLGNCFNSKCGLTGSSARGSVMTYGLGWGAGRATQDGGAPGVLAATSHRCTAETTTRVQSNYAPLDCVRMLRTEARCRGTRCRGMGPTQPWTQTCPLKAGEPGQRDAASPRQTQGRLPPKNTHPSPRLSCRARRALHTPRTLSGIRGQRSVACPLLGGQSQAWTPCSSPRPPSCQHAASRGQAQGPRP